ncbi:MAG: hypothetical protein IPO36_21600 [Anaerolineales bacterium]|nr:hypothetical protein [Anaerolineales bacterium]
MLTSMLEDYSRPRPMTDVERAAFLSIGPTYSGWMRFACDSRPQPTVTLTPIALP